MRRYWRFPVVLALLTLLATVSGLQRRAALSGPAAGPATVAVVRADAWPVSDEEVESLVREAVALAGGLEGIVEPGDVVVIKPNLVWGGHPDEGYTTDPRVVRAVVRLVQEAGAGQVIIADGAARYREDRDERGATLDAFRRCGYDADGDLLDDETGVPLVDLNDAGGLDQHDPALVTEVTVPNGLIQTSYWLPRVVMEADVLITVPVLKNHFAAGVTLALKNQFGVAPSDVYHSPGSRMYKGALGHGPDDLGRHIVDLNLARPPDFAVVDGLRGMTDGPTGGTLVQPPMRLIMAGADPVAVDTVGALVMGYDPRSIPYLAWAAGAGLGTDDVAQITVRGLRVSQVRRDFPAPYGDPPAQRAEATPPTVRITAPEEGLVVADQTTVWAEASDDRAVVKVEFYVGDDLVVVDTRRPYQATLDLSAHRGETVAIRAVAYDRALNDAEDEISVVVVGTAAPGTASFQTATITIPTYPYEHCLINESDGPYTYRRLDWGCYGNPSPIPRDYTLLILENDYLRVTVLPELGGRVYQMVFKPTGHNELYQNPVIKPTHWGPPKQKWWLAVGGIEWCLPVDEHGYEWGEPWSWSVVTSTQGVTVTLWDTTATDRLRARVDLFLPADRAVLAITPRLENPTGSAISYKYWTNAMLAPGGANTVGADLRFVYGADRVTVHSSGDFAAGTVLDWPVHNGRDYSRLGNWNRWLGFFERPQAQADFVGVYDEAADEGIARVFPSDVVRGSKGFGMGWADPIDWHEWTDDGSTYVEVHGGVAPTFWDVAQLPAGAALSWTEHWFPVASLGTLSAATTEAALGIRQEGRFLYIGTHSTTARPDGTARYVWDRATCTTLGRWSLPALDPATPFRAVADVGGRTVDELAIVYLDEGGQPLVGINTVDCLPPQARVDPLPPWVGTTGFTVTWSGEDVWTGVAAYDVQVRDGYEGTWTGWLTDTVATSAVFTGVHGHTYFFRARARDVVGNWGAFTDEEWGQAFTTVLTETAPVLATSRKVAAPRRFAPDQTVAYTVLVSNTGSLTATARLTDTPPGELVLLTGTLTATAGAPPTYDGTAIRWAGEVPPGGEVRVTYVLSPTASTPMWTPLTNTVWIDGSVLGPLARREVVLKAHLQWLPIIYRNR